MDITSQVDCICMQLPSHLLKEITAATRNLPVELKHIGII